MLSSMLTYGNTWLNLWSYRPRSTLEGHHLNLGRPWLAMDDSYIGCRSRNLIISHGNSMKILTLYSLTKPSTENERTMWIEDEVSDE
jgi:hypothetical protein